MKVENFIVNKDDYVDEIVSFYNKENYNKARLVEYWGMLLDLSLFQNHFKFKS